MVAHSVECHCNLRNVQDFLTEEKTPYETRFGEPFKGPIIPFGALVENHMISTRDQSRLHQFGKKVLPGIFLGCELIAGGIWKGDILIAELEDLEGLDASEIYPRRINAKEVLISQKNEFIFPVADGAPKLQGRAYDFREPTLAREPTVRSEVFCGKLQGESEESQPTETADDAEVRADLWSIQGDFIYRHHNEPRVKLYSPREESFPIPLKYIDVTRSTHTDLDLMQEKRIDDYWNVDSNRNWSDSWKGFTKFTLLKEKPPKDICGPGYRIDPDDQDYKETFENARRKLERPMAAAMPCKRKAQTSTTKELRSRKLHPKRFPKRFVVVLWNLKNPQGNEWNLLYSKKHEDHIAGKGSTSMTHYYLVHKFIPMLQAMKISDAKSAVDKEWKKFERIPAWQLENVKSKKEVILGAQRDKKKVHFASLMDICLLKNAELKPK